MSLIDKLEEKALKRVHEDGAEWVGKFADKMRGELPEGDGAEVKAIRETGEFAIKRIEENKDKLARLGEEGLVVFLAQIGRGQFDKAGGLLRKLSSGQAGWGGIGDAITAAGDRTMQAKADQDAAIALAKDIGSAAAKALVPIALGLVGL